MITSRLLKFVSSGVAVAYFFMHPAVMVISYAMPANPYNAGHGVEANLSFVFFESFSVGMLPWSLGFAILGGWIGYLFYKRQLADEEKNLLICELQAAQLENKTLSGLLPICCVCKQIRDDNDDWHRVETYISEYSNATFSHTYCPDCKQKVFDTF